MVGPAVVIPLKTEYVIFVTAVIPVLLKVQVVLAAVGVVVGVTMEQEVKLSAGNELFTCKLTGVDAPEPVLGVIVSVPL